MKLPYERIAPEANKLFEKMTQSQDMDEVNRLYDLYVALLESSGWTPATFDQAMLERVNKDWDEPKKET